MTQTRRIRICILAALALTGAAFAVSLLVGKYPIQWDQLTAGGMDARVFFTLRLPRSCMALLAGLALGAAGSVYQTVFRNPLASPDIIGVASGATVGAAAAILLFGSGVLLTALFAFAGGMAAVLLVLAMAAASRRRDTLGIVLAGIAVNALAQAVLMLLKLTADPERQLAAIEFWTMGSFADITLEKFLGVLPFAAAGLAGLALLRRQILLLALGDDEARMLGVRLESTRRLVLLLATLVTGAVVSMTGLISFIGLLAPHIARLLAKSSRFSVTVLAALCGSALLLAADILARSLGSSEVPVSIVTSLLGAPFLFWLLCRKEEQDG